MMHQSDILTAAFASTGSTAAFDIELTRLFGSPFTRKSSNPQPSEKTRRFWQNWAAATPKKRESQLEQRLLDVTARDLLSIVHGISPTQKTNWQILADELMARSAWDRIATNISASTGSPDMQSGYFWSAVLAAAANFTATGVTPTSAQVSLFISARAGTFHNARYPRARTGNSIRPIKEIRDSSAVNIAAGQVCTALASSQLPVRDKHIVLTVVGALISADLWSHPAGVRYLLIPACRALHQTFGSRFSLNTPSIFIADYIEQILGSRWGQGKAW